MKKAFIIILLALVGPCLAVAQEEPAPLGSLKTVPVPEPPDLGNYVRNRTAAIQLGKALFWDMQLGSDGIQACASCHFQAGADRRARNQLNPGVRGGDTDFAKGGPNGTLLRSDFPFREWINPDFPDQGLARPVLEDVAGSQGIVLKRFIDIVPGNAVDLGEDIADPLFNIAGRNIRQVTARNSPSVINAAYNFNNFWDGRAHNVFNGVNPFGPADSTPKIVVSTSNGLQRTLIRIRNASLASQATGPPLDDVEMSWRGRTWPKIGKKMLSLTPLAKQTVHHQDSVLGVIANSTATAPAKGLKVSYESLIRQAFQPRFWNNTTQIVTYSPSGVPTISARPDGPLSTSQYTQMEANFSLFFGLATQIYQATLIANDSRFDRFMEGTEVLTDQELSGMNTFQGAGSCTACHIGPELTAISVANLLLNPINDAAVPNPSQNPLNAIEFMSMLSGTAFYDVGYYNIGVELPQEDIGRGGDSRFVNKSLPGTRLPLSYTKLALLRAAGNLPTQANSIGPFSPPLPVGHFPEDTVPTPGRMAINGAFKTPGLRNIELTGPYMHNGGFSTIRQVVEFYTRGGDFTAQNLENQHPEIRIIGKLRGSPTKKRELVAFLLTLTDERVKNESAPFDHPELFIPNGATDTGGDRIGRLPAVGNGGRSAEGLPLLQSFLGVDNFRP